MSQDVGHQVNNVSNTDARSAVIPQRVTNLEGLITSVVQAMREERRSRENITITTAERVNMSGQAQARETSTEGLADLCDGVSGLTSPRTSNRQNIIMSGRDRSEATVRTDLGDRARAWHESAVREYKGAFRADIFPYSGHHIFRGSTMNKVGRNFTVNNREEAMREGVFDFKEPC